MDILYYSIMNDVTFGGSLCPPLKSAMPSKQVSVFRDTCSMPDINRRLFVSVKIVYINEMYVKFVTTKGFCLYI